MLKNILLAKAILVALSFSTSAAAEFVTVKDGHFYLGDRRIRFWGIGVVATGNWDHQEISYATKRIRGMGFNAIREHMYDPYLFGTGDPKLPSYTIPDYTPGDESGIDRLDFAVSEAGKRNLYLYMSFNRWSAPRPADYDVLPAKGTTDRKTWEQALAKSGNQFYIDDRLGEAFRRAAKNQLLHVNKYTGLKYAEDPRIALWEITNENNFVDLMLNGGFQGLDDYFKRQLFAKWHRWLKGRYKSTQALEKVWGRLNSGELLEGETIVLAPVRSDPVVAAITAEQKNENIQKAQKDEKIYTDARGRDVVRFVIDLYNGYNQDFIKFVRSLAPNGVGINVVPITVTTSNANWSLACHYANSLGSCTTGGNYEVQFTGNKNDPRFPWQTRLESFPAFAGNTEAQPFTGKPIVGYECNMYRPCAFLAEMPGRLATYAAWNDWDGIFWFGWPCDHNNMRNDSDLFSLPLFNENPNGGGIGLTFHNDEVFMSQLKAQGAMFLNFDIRPAAAPNIHVYGSDILYDMYDKSWFDILRIRVEAHVQGARIKVDPNGPSSPWVRQAWAARSELKNAVPGQPFSMPSTSSPVKSTSGEIMYQWKGPGQGGVLLLDSVRCKSVIGWPGKNIQFHDDWRFSDIRIKTLTGRSIPNSEGFACLTMASNDGLPLNKSKEIVISLVSKNQNTGFKIDGTLAKPGIIRQLASSVVNPGTTPVLVDRVGAVLTGPFAAGAKYFKYSFDLKCYESGKVDGKLTISPDEPLFYCAVKKDVPPKPPITIGGR